mmetsp:Transcript_9265/g.28839  ORF Transcript_9265/g.28839 Transcript_9265/m.28839 type:complete len:403 (+) Transcript_9265:1140-2348(+)
MVDAAVRLEDEVTRRLDELVFARNQKKVVREYLGALAQVLLRAVKVVAHVQALEELAHRVGKGVLLHLDDANEVLLHARAALVDHHRRGQVAQQVRCGGLDGVQVPFLHEEVHDEVPPILVVEEDEERPVQQPRTLLQLHEARGKLLGVDALLEPVEVVQRHRPVLHQNLGAKLAPQRVEGLLLRARERAVVVQELGRRRIVAAVKLQLGERVQRLHLLVADAIRLEQRQVVLAVGLQAGQLLRVREELHNGRSLLDQRLHLVQHTLAHRYHRRGRLLRALEQLVDVDGEVNHVGLLEQRELGAQDGLVIVAPLGLQKLEQRQHQVLVQVLGHRVRQVVPGDARGGGARALGAAAHGGCLPPRAPPGGHRRRSTRVRHAEAGPRRAGGGRLLPHAQGRSVCQ